MTWSFFQEKRTSARQNGMWFVILKIKVVWYSILSEKNIALLSKWLIKLRTEDEVWQNLIKRKYVGSKDVERDGLGVLQTRWVVVRHPARIWRVETLWEVMTDCVIIHNMIVKNERDDSVYDQGWEFRVDWVREWSGNVPRAPPYASWNPWLVNSRWTSK